MAWVGEVNTIRRNHLDDTDPLEVARWRRDYYDKGMTPGDAVVADINRPDDITPEQIAAFERELNHEGET